MDSDTSKKGFFLAFDFGTANIGVAVGQKLTKTATPLKTLRAKDGEPNWQEVEALIKKWQPQALLVGVPVQLDGTSEWTTVAAQEFIARLKERFALPVYGVEERLTTKSAREMLFKSGGYKALQDEEIDSFAAQLILESWLAETEADNVVDRT